MVACMPRPISEPSMVPEPLHTPKMKPRCVSVGPILPPHGTINPIHPDVGTLRTVRLLVRYWARMQLALGFPRKWSLQTVRLIGFVLLMLPGFIPPFLSYLFSKQIAKNINYGPSWRNQLDVYFPCSTDGVKGLHVRRPSGGFGSKAPVVVFISGGAWIIGYKAWGFIMGQLMQKQGVLFITPDYRNFPEVNVKGMVDDVLSSLDWLFEHIRSLGGDPEDVTLMGQSAGAHISSLAILERISQEQSASKLSECRNDGDTLLQLQEAKPRWSVGSLKRWVGISGPYDMVEALPKFRRKGMPSFILQSVLSKDLQHHSPTLRVRDLAVGRQHKSIAMLPPMYLFHGTSDDTVDWTQSENFAKALRESGTEVHTKFYANKSHTDPILEDPVAGAEDELMRDLLALLKPEPCSSDGMRCWQPRSLLQCAKILNPF